MSDRRYNVRGHAKQGDIIKDNVGDAIAFSDRDITRSRKRSKIAHLAPISLTPVVSPELPVANRNSA